MKMFSFIIMKVPRLSYQGSFIETSTVQEEQTRTEILIGWRQTVAISRGTLKKANSPNVSSDRLPRLFTRRKGYPSARVTLALIGLPWYLPCKRSARDNSATWDSFLLVPGPLNIDNKRPSFRVVLGDRVTLHACQILLAVNSGYL